jgi:hypothetical protein
MKIDERILKEIYRYKSINKYINEQEAPIGDEGSLPPPPGEEPPMDMDAPAGEAQMGETPPPPETPVDINPSEDPEVEELTDEGEDEVEELEITDLIDTQKTMVEKQEEYFENLFNQINKMEEKLSEMDNIVSKLDSLETKFEKYRPKTPQEKLELRSLDSGPFKQNLTDFFKEKGGEMEKTGKNEYVLTQSDVENFSPSEIEKTFNEPIEDEDDYLLNRYNS